MSVAASAQPRSQLKPVAVPLAVVVVKQNDIEGKILADIENRLKLDAQWQDKTFIPHPTTYLNGERWNDDITPIEEKQKAAQLPKNVNELMVFGTKMGLPARPGEDEYPYRQRLQAAL